MRPKQKNIKDFRIHTSLIEEAIKTKERKKRLFRHDLIQEGKRKERLVTDTLSQYEMKYLLGPNLSIIVKRIVPLEDIDRLHALNIGKVSQVKNYSRLISAGAGFDIQDGEIVEQYFKDELTILYNANQIDMIAAFRFFYDNSAAVSYSRNINLALVEFKNGKQTSRIGKCNPAYIYNLLFDLLEKEKKAKNYYRWRKGLGFGFNKQTV